MGKKSISPIIATILLIIMTVGVAALMYTWLSGMFTQLTTQAAQQVAAMGAVNFMVGSVTGVNTAARLFNVSIVNQGRVRIVMNSTTTSARITAYDVLTGRLTEVVFCGIIGSLSIDPGATGILQLNCTGLSTIDPVLYKYSIEVTYFGITSSATYP